MEMLKKYKKILISCSILLIMLIAGVLNYYLNTSEDNYVNALEQECICETNKSEEIQEEFYVDIKGAIKNPGVYLANENNIVKDIIDLAGGIKSNGTTDNINLSQHVTSEMVIYVCTKTELKNGTTTTTSQSISSSATITTSCGTASNSNGSSTSEEKVITLVNINTASKEELMTIPNIGESKADAIIIYRMETPFTRIEDIMNVSGIGESIFVKIKDYITV